MLAPQGIFVPYVQYTVRGLVEHATCGGGITDKNNGRCREGEVTE